MKRIAQRLLIVVLILTLIMPYSFADNGKKLGHIKNGKFQVNTELQNELKNKAASDQLKEQLRMMVTYGEGKWGDVPHGFTKSGYLTLPPGLMKQYEAGKLPYGIAKKYDEWIDYVQNKDQDDDDNDVDDQDDDQDVVDKDDLDELILEGEDLIADYSIFDPNDPTDITDKVYDPEDKIYKGLQAELADAQLVSDDTDATQEEIDDAYEELEDAIELFRANIILDMTLLTDLQAEMQAYYDVYFVTPDSNPAKTKASWLLKKAELEKLLDDIQAFLDENVPLTQAVWAEFEERADDFVDFYDVLDDLIKETQAKIDAHIADGDVGDEVDQYAQDAIDALQDAVDAAELVLLKEAAADDPDDSDDLAKYEAAYEALLEALDVFEGEIIIIIGADDPILVIKAELGLIFVDEPNDKDLEDLVEDLADVDANDLMTQNAYDELIAAAGPYLDGLYDGIVEDLKKEIDKAIKLHENATAGSSHWQGAIDKLMEEIEKVADLSVDPYVLLVDVEDYIALKDAMTLISEAIDVFNSKELIDNAKRAELLDIYMELDALVDTTVADYETTPEYILMMEIEALVKYPEGSTGDTEYDLFVTALNDFKTAYDGGTYDVENIVDLFKKTTTAKYEDFVERYDGIINPPVVVTTN